MSTFGPEEVEADAAFEAAKAEWEAQQAEMPLPCCSGCGEESDDLTEQTSMGIYAGRYCSTKCWRASGYRDVGPEAFDPSYAGESMDEED